MRVDLFARRLSQLLEIRGMTGKQFAEEMGVTARTVSRWVTGVGGAPLKRLPDICRVLGVTEEQFWDTDWRPDIRVPIGTKPGIESFRSGPYLGFPTDEDGLACECPRCGANDYSVSAKYCRRCGYPLRNFCTSPDPRGRHQNASDAAFCEECARPTFWSLEYVTLDEILGRSEIRILHNDSGDKNTPS